MKNPIVIKLDLIRVITVINIALLFGLFISMLGWNRYLILVLMLLTCGVLSYLSQEAFVKRFGSENMISRTRGFRALTVVLNLIIIIYYIKTKEYIIVACIVIMYIIYLLAIDHIKKNKKKRKDPRKNIM